MDVISFDKFSAQICGEIQAAAEKNGKQPPAEKINPQTQTVHHIPHGMHPRIVCIHR